MSKKYIGVVENINDPLMLGRCQVRIFGIHTPSKIDLPTSDLSWSPVEMPVTSASMSGIGMSPTFLLPGTWVRLECLDGDDLQQFMIVGTTVGFPNTSSTTVDFSSAETGEAQSNPAPQAVPQQPAVNPTPLQPDNSGWVLGQTSEKYESGGHGPGTISARISNDKGGESYGQWQFASYCPATMQNGQPRQGYAGSALQLYLASSRWESQFSGLLPATDAFDAVWKQIASTSPTDFGNEQHAYIKANFYNVMLNRLKRLNLDLTGFGSGVQDLVWSTAVQFGPGKTSIFTTPLSGQTNLTDVQIVTLVSDYKISTYSAYATRYTAEKAALLALCNGAVVPTNAAQANTVVTDPNAAPFDLVSTDNQSSLIGATLGFSDPGNMYPLPAYDNLPDTNKLAQGISQGTQSQDKQNNRTLGVRLPNGTFDEPNSPFAAQYPHNKVFGTTSGHIIEIDDTPGGERINVYHKSGSYWEMDSIGNSVRKAVGSDFQFIDGNSYVSIDGKMNVSVSGSVNVYIGADANIQVDGNTTLNCGNNIKANAGGRMSLTSAVAIDLQAPDIFITSDNSTNLLAGTNLSMQANGVASMLSSGVVAFDAPLVAENSGMSLSATASQGVELGGATDYDETIIPDVFANVALRKMAAMVESPEDSDSVDQLHAAMIASGMVTADQLNQTGITAATDTTPNPPANNNSPVDCLYINTLTTIPDNFKLSPNYVLADVSTKALAGGHQVAAQAGLTVPQIVCNLYQVVTNCLEPIRQAFPGVKVNSGFRTSGGSISTSQHPKGMALDLHWDGMSAADYMNRAVAIKQLLNGAYDQLILESLSGGHNWIHISYSAGSNRGQVFTMFNNKKFADGLVLVN